MHMSASLHTLWLLPLPLVLIAQSHASHRPLKLCRQVKERTLISPRPWPSPPPTSPPPASPYVSGRTPVFHPLQGGRSPSPNASWVGGSGGFGSCPAQSPGV